MQEFSTINAVMTQTTVPPSRFKHRIRFATSLATTPIKLLTVPSRPSPEEITKFALNQYGIRALQVPSELLRFSKIVAVRGPKMVVEIGTGYGGALLVWCRLAHPEATVISVNLPRRPNAGGYSIAHIPIIRMFATSKQSLHLIRDDSHDLRTRDAVKKILAGRPIDLLFIDGDHSYEGVKVDFDLYSPFVRSGGLIAFHDIVKHATAERDNCFVDRFWNEIKRRYAHEEIIDNQSQGWAGIGLLYP